MRKPRHDPHWHGGKGRDPEEFVMRAEKRTNGVADGSDVGPQIEKVSKRAEIKKTSEQNASVETPSQPCLPAGKAPPTRGRSYLSAYTGDIDLFILPGFEFQIVDAMITNFHLPKSTLLMLVSAFAGDTEFMLSCYQEAVAERYRFFSFGDGMFIY